jgi:hypothetical protein
LGVFFSSRALVDRLLQVLQRRQQLLAGGQRGADVDGGGDHVVRALPVIDVVVRMHLRTRGNCQVRYHLVCIHVGAGARTGLEDVDRELRVVLAVRHRQRRLADRRRLTLFQMAQRQVHVGRRGLDQPQRTDERPRQVQAGNREVVDRALGLRAIQRVSRDLQLAHAVVFDAEVAHWGCPWEKMAVNGEALSPLNTRSG